MSSLLTLSVRSDYRKPGSTSCVLRSIHFAASGLSGPDVMETTMRKLLTFLIALASIAFLLFGSATAQVGGLSFPGPGTPHSSGGVAFSITNTDKKADTSAGTVITYNAGGNPSIGATNGGNRIIAFTLSGQGFGGSTPTATINGVAATRAGSRFSGNAGVGLFYLSDSAAGSSALTSVPIVVTYGGAVNSSEIGVYVSPHPLQARPQPSLTPPTLPRPRRSQRQLQSPLAVVELQLRR